MGPWNRLTPDFYDEDGELDRYDRESEDNWMVQINGAEDSAWRTKAEAIDALVEHLNCLSDGRLEIEITGITTRIKYFEEVCEDLEEMITYLLEMPAETFHQTLRHLGLCLNLPGTFQLVNLNGEEFDFEEL